MQTIELLISMTVVHCQPYMMILQSNSLLINESVKRRNSELIPHNIKLWMRFRYLWLRLRKISRIMTRHIFSANFIFIPIYITLDNILFHGHLFSFGITSLSLLETLLPSVHSNAARRFKTFYFSSISS